MATLEIRDYSRNGMYQITDTNWDSNGTLRVTVREMMGVRPNELAANGLSLEAMRRLARRALAHPEKTRSARTLCTWHADGSTHATFAISRLAR